MSVKALVVLSGGMDSATALYLAKQEFDLVEAITFNYGQQHGKEVWFAEGLATFANVRWDLIPLQALGHHLKSALTDPTIAVPEGHYADETMKATVVPNRNMIMLSIACGIAISRECNQVIIGVHAGDHPIYPDCRPEFIDSFNSAVRLGSEGFHVDEFQVCAPFINMEKSDIASMGDQLGVPWEQTWSCYKGGTLHCGKCGTCVERREAFSIAGLVDPTMYELDIK